MTCRTVATSILIFVVSVFAALALFEVYARAIKPPVPLWTRAHEMLYQAPESYMRYRPYIGLLEEPFSNAYPFTVAGDERATKEKAPGTLRVIILGGSVAQSRGLELRPDRKDFDNSPRFSPPGAWWKRCSADFARVGSGSVEVLPAGIQATVTTQEVIRILTADLLDWHPDAIVMLDGHNDVYASRLRGVRPGLDLFAPFRRFFFEHPLAFGLYKLFSWSEGASLIFKAYAERKIAKEITSRTAEQIAERMTKNYVVAHAIAKGIGARFAVVHQPTAWMHLEPSMAETFDRISELTRQWAERERVPFFSYLRLLDGRRELFYDQVHFTGEGYELLCASLSRDLAPMIATH